MLPLEDPDAVTSEIERAPSGTEEIPELRVA